MKIKTKLLMGLCATPILIFLLIGIGWLQVTNLHRLSTATHNNFELSVIAEQIQTDIKNEAITLRNIVIFNDKELIEKELKILKQESNNTSKDIVLLESKVNTAEQKILVGNLKDTNQRFYEYKKQVIEQKSQGNQAEAIDVIITNSNLIHLELFETVSELTKHFEKNMETSFSTTTEGLQQQTWISSIIALVSTLLITAYLFRTIWTLVTRLSKVSAIMTKVADGSADLGVKVEVIASDEIDDVARSFNRMTDSLEDQRIREQGLIWIKSNIADITTCLSGNHELETLSKTFLSKVAPLMESSHALFYGKDNANNEQQFKLFATYASDKKDYPTSFLVGEGLIGQAALEKKPIILTDVPSDYLRIKSGLIDARPLSLYVLPVVFEGDVKAVIEIASFKPFNPHQQLFIEELINSLGIILESVMGRIQLAKILEETQVLMEEVQAQSEELQGQQEELRVVNEELEEQTQALRNSEQILQSQQEELEQTNSELEEKAEILEEQNKMFELTNREVERARAELEEKAKQLAVSSKYKSEFLANMSHELRTPLNSLLILSKLLADNPSGNLSEKQVKYSKTIYSSGNDLLATINDILDLAKIESGKMDVYPSNIFVKDLAEYVESRFRPIASEKNLGFNIVIQEDIPDSIYTDEQRLQQVLKNLLSNAFKFTRQGEVGLEFCWKADDGFSFSVIDSGIGIPSDKQELIFQAFQQADGTTSRRYGGTGLGLSICREISNLLNGEIVVESEEGKGSKFSFIVPNFKKEIEDAIHVDQEIAIKESAATKEATMDLPETNSVENIPIILETIPSREPNSGIKRLLIVDDDVRQRSSLMEHIGGMDIIIKAVSSGKEALEELKVNKFDCVILDLGLADTNGFILLERIKTDLENDHLQVFIYTGRDLTLKEEMFLKKYSHTIIIKDAHSPQRLKDELEMYLNSGSEEIGTKNQLVAGSSSGETGLEGKRVLLVDDDVRNVFALMSFLEIYHMEITFAENGKESLEVLEKDPNFDLVLMDIMMPEMDGYEAIRRIRAIPHFYDLPIIALTAKAMKEDRDKCIEAGASDYIVKPFDPDQLLSLTRVWLYKKEVNSTKYISNN
jgi:two-component system, chemotaxis family, sensor kinase CheA